MSYCSPGSYMNCNYNYLSLEAFALFLTKQKGKQIPQIVTLFLGISQGDRSAMSAECWHTN